MEELPVEISRERWQAAQAWELEVWRGQERRGPRSLRTRAREGLRRLFGKETVDPGDDWNEWWAEQFEGYSALPEELDKAVELGCGPYTNMRLILRNRKIRHVCCSDPLAREYVRFKGRWLAEAWKSGRVTIDDHPLENCPFDNAYSDLVVLINVLDHVRSCVSCLEQAMRITKPGGYLVVGQDLTDLEDARRVGDDPGHPIRVSRELLDNALAPAFERVLYKILAREQGRNPSAHCGTYVCIGKKRS